MLTVKTFWGLLALLAVTANSVFAATQPGFASSKLDAGLETATTMLPDAKLRATLGFCLDRRKSQNSANQIRFSKASPWLLYWVCADSQTARPETNDLWSCAATDSDRAAVFPNSFSFATGGQAGVASRSGKDVFWNTGSLADNCLVADQTKKRPSSYIAPILSGEQKEGFRAGMTLSGQLPFGTMPSMRQSSGEDRMTATKLLDTFSGFSF